MNSTVLIPVDTTFTTMMIIFAVLIAIAFALLVASGRVRSPKTAYALILSGVLATVLAGVTYLVVLFSAVSGEEAIIPTLEKEMGITVLTPIGDDYMRACNGVSGDHSAEYTWLDENGDPTRGLVAMNKTDDVCEYSVTDMPTN